MTKEEAYRIIIDRYRWHMPKDVSGCIKNEKDEQSEYIVQLFIEELFLNNCARDIEWCKKQLESIDEKDGSEEYIVGVINKLSETLIQLRRLRKHESKEIKKAEVLQSVYAYEKAICIYEELLSKDLNRKDEIQIRRYLTDLYDEIDIEGKYFSNLKRLLELGVKDDESIRRYIFYVINHDFSVDIFSTIKKPLKSQNAGVYWRLIIDQISTYNRQLLDLYEYVRPPAEILGAELIGIIVSQYYDNNSFRKAEQLLDKCYAKEIWNSDLSYYKVLLLLQKRSLKEAEELVDSELQMNRNNAKINKCKGDLLFDRKDYITALNHYQIAFNNGEEIRTIRNLALCEIMLEKENEAKKRVSEWVEQQNKTTGYFMIYMWTLYQEFPKSFMIDMLNSLKPRKLINERHPVLSEVALQHILMITENEQEKGIVRYHLLFILSYIDRIKRHLKYRGKAGRVYHYSSLKSMKGLLSVDDQSRHLRLYNEAYMNDPAEGNILYDIIEKYNHEELADVMQSIKEDEETFYRDNYIASFSKKADFLPMWVHYSNGGTGVCYSINPSLFDTYDPYDFQVINGEDVGFGSAIDDEKGFVLRNVCYCHGDSIENDKELESLCNMFSNQLVEIKNEIQANEQVKTFIKNCLEDIRYLFKDDAYESEQELRVIVKDVTHERKIEYRDDELIPHLYLDMDKPIKFDEVMIGPKASNVAGLSAYLNVCTNVERVCKSAINYR